MTGMGQMAPANTEVMLTLSYVGHFLPLKYYISYIFPDGPFGPEVQEVKPAVRAPAAAFFVLHVLFLFNLFFRLFFLNHA